MVPELNLALQSFRVLADMVKAIKNLDERAKIVEAIYEVNEKLVATSIAATAILDENAALKEENKKFKNWEAEVKRYTMVEVLPGIPAYAPKPGMENGEPPHHLCANCFAKGEKGFLNSGPPEIGGLMMCGNCGGKFFSSGQKKKTGLFQLLS